MEHYVTLFDSLFLPQGLTLHSSMEKHAGEYTLWILCMDNNAHDVLLKLNLPNVKLLELSKFETDELRQVKPSRTKGEYCWTLTPFTPKFVFQEDSTISRVTYLDADVWFRKSPTPIFQEFDASGKNVLITDHAYAPENDFSVTSGQFCVQFIVFTKKGELVRKWWEERCIEWCFSRFEDGKFGDQKYLDLWPDKFPEHVHILLQKELTLAPWNVARFPYGQAIFYHFHGLRLLEKKKVKITSFYKIPNVVMDNVYQPYLNDLKQSVMTLKGQGWIFQKQADLPNCFSLIKFTLKSIYYSLVSISDSNIRRF